MRTPLTTALALSIVSHLSVAEPPALPESITVAGADVETSEHATPRAPKDPASLSGVYGSHSITDGMQWLGLKVHRGPGKAWLVDGTLTTEYRPNAPQIVQFTNAPLTISRGHAWFDTGIPNLHGHAVTFTEPRVFPQDPKGAPQPALIMADSVYLPNSKTKPPRPDQPAQKRSTAKLP